MNNLRPYLSDSVLEIDAKNDAACSNDHSPGLIYDTLPLEL